GLKRERTPDGACHFEWRRLQCTRNNWLYVHGPFTADGTGAPGLPVSAATATATATGLPAAASPAATTAATATAATAAAATQQPRTARFSFSHVQQGRGGGAH
ncbi:unnamed protein product, partial [Laminaria digitata]